MENKMDHLVNFYSDIKKVAEQIDIPQIELLAKGISTVREKNGRLFFLGVGGSAGNCSHAVNDFRKLCGIEAYAPTDNVSELTARINDDGWDGAFAGWLNVSKLKENDAIFIFSVGGGNLEKNVSVNLIKAIDFAKTKNAKVFGIVSRDGGYCKKEGDIVVVVPVVNEKLVTPISEAYQAVVWHSLVSHPILQVQATKW